MSFDKHNHNHTAKELSREKDGARDSQSPVRLLSLAEAAKYLGISSYTVRDFLFTGIIPCVKLPHAARDGRVIKRVLIDIADLDRLISESKTHS